MIDTATMYELSKTPRVIAVISWMAGMLYCQSAELPGLVAWQSQRSSAR